MRLKAVKVCAEGGRGNKEEDNKIKKVSRTFQ